MTLDGVIEDPGGSEHLPHGGWAFQFQRGPEGDKFKLDEVLSAGALLLGRVTYEGFAEAWVSRTGEFADKMNNMPKFVVSTTLKKTEWNNSTIIKDNVAAQIKMIKEQPGQDILVAGSSELVHTLMQLDLVDELRLMIYPVILGSGKRFFKDSSHRKILKLVENKPLDSGIFILTYQPDADRKEIS